MNRLLPARALLFGLFCLLFSHTVSAQETSRHNKWWHKFRPDSVQKWKFTFLPVPIFTSAPETGVKVGVALNYFFNAGDKDSSRGLSRDSYVYADVEYSSRRQLFTDLYGQVYTKGERYFLRGRLGYADNYERVWGFGNFSVPDNRYQEVEYSRWHFQATASRQFRPKMFAGLRTNFSLMHKVQATARDSNLIASQAGAGGSRISGLGPTLILDKRDHPLGPEKGYYAEAAVTFHEPAFGSSYRYTETLIDLRRYFSRGPHTLAFQGFAQLNAGTVPWRELPRMGNPTIMRGYFNGRFRGQDYMALQAEYRIRAHRWFGFAVFGAAGQVQDRLGETSFADTRFAGGGGLRLYVSQKKRITLRLDYGVTTDKTSGFYIKVGEAF